MNGCESDVKCLSKEGGSLFRELLASHVEKELVAVGRVREEPVARRRRASHFVRKIFISNYSLRHNVRPRKSAIYLGDLARQHYYKTI